MARPRLNDATKAKAKSSAQKLPTSSAIATATLPNKSVSTNGRNALAVPGLPQLLESELPSHIPKINTEAYRIDNPHKLPETLPQVSDSQLDDNKRLAKGATNAQESEILALQVTTGKFNVIKEQAKTSNAGLQAVLEIKKTEGALLDLRSQEEINAQKTTKLDYNIYKTDKEISISSFNKLSLDEKERLAASKAGSQKADADYADVELQNKLKKLGLI